MKYVKYFQYLYIYVVLCALPRMSKFYALLQKHKKLSGEG